MSGLEPSDYWSEFAERLEQLGLEPVLIGGLAARRYRHRDRFTTDVDFLTRELGDLPERMQDAGFSVRTMAEPGSSDPYVVFIRGNGMKVDVLKAETPFQESAIDRAIDGIITAEDVIVFKLLAGRPRDQDDVQSILAAGHELDEPYIERWAAEWEVLDRWEDAKRLADRPAR